MGEQTHLSSKSRVPQYPFGPTRRKLALFLNSELLSRPLISLRTGPPAPLFTNAAQPVPQPSYSPLSIPLNPFCPSFVSCSRYQPRSVRRSPLDRTMSSPLKRRLASSPPLDVRWLPTANQLVRHLPKRRHIASFANEKPLLRPSLLTHRGRDSGIFSSSDTETDATSEDELGTALSDVESEVRGAERNEASPVDGDDEEIDIVLMASSAPWSPVAHAWPEEKGKGVDPREHGERSRKRRRVETPDANSDGEGDDEREAELMLVDMTKSKKTLLGPGSGKRTLHRVRDLPFHWTGRRLTVTSLTHSSLHGAQWLLPNPSSRSPVSWTTSLLPLPAK